jgi:UDP-N-acetylglucosamine 2-epimerase (non-hydrolysing)
MVGNTMIDTLLKHRELAQNSDILNRLGLKKIENNNSTNATSATNSTNPYAILTLHRPSNVDGRELFMEILEALSVISEKIPTFFPVHPRTLNRIKEFGLEKYFTFLHSISNLQPLTCGIHCVEPLGYLDFLCLMSNARLVLTDSGGIQEEATVLDIPCVTLRENTERPITITHGTNILAGIEKEQIIKSAFLQLRKYNKGTSSSPQSSSLSPQASAPPLWDGRAGERIIKILASRIR